MILDLHCDTVYNLWKWRKEVTIDHADTMVDGEKMKKGGVKNQCFAIFTSPNLPEWHASLSPWEVMQGIHGRFVLEMGRSRFLTQAVSREEMEADGMHGILTVEDLGPAEGLRDREEEIVSWGVRLCTLTWNHENVYAYPASDDKVVMGRGLKKKGLEVLEFFREKNVVLDVSHLNDGGFWDIIESGVKVIASHSDCRALVDHRRNLSDEMIRALSDRGGVAGLNFYPDFLSADGKKESRIQDMVAHVMHMYKVGGEDVLALGSDFDGMSGTFEIKDASSLPLLFDALSKAGLSERQIEKMQYRNALRVF